MTNLFRPTVTSPACCKIHLCPSTLWTSSVLSPRIPLRTFHVSRFRAAANKPAAPISTLMSPFLPSSPFARRIPISSHGIATSISSPRAASLPSVDVPVQSQNYFRNPPSSIDLAFKAPPKELQRETVLPGWIWNPPHPSGDAIVVKSSLLGRFLRFHLEIVVAAAVLYLRCVCQSVPTCGSVVAADSHLGPGGGEEARDLRRMWEGNGL